LVSRHWEIAEEGYEPERVDGDGVFLGPTLQSPPSSLTPFWAQKNRGKFCKN